MSEKPGSLPASPAPAAALAARRRRSNPSGWWGMALLVATETALFGTLLASYFYLRFRATDWPPAGIPEPKVALPLVLTAALVATSLPMFLSVRAARAGRVRATWLLIALAVGVQIAFFAIQTHLYLDDLSKFKPAGSAYGSIYFTLLGVHQVHVGIGALLSLWVMAKLLGGLTSYRLTAVRVLALYWYFVNAMAIFVVATLLSPT